MSSLKSKNSNKSSIDNVELQKFNKNYEEWWGSDGEFKLLHQINSLRVEYITSIINRYFTKIKSKTLLDVGCGGGLVSVPMHRLGLKVSGLDANQNNIKVAKKYATINKLDIKYINDTVENHINLSQKYDIILCLEVIEHVANQKEFIINISKLLTNSGVMIFSTINRNKKAFCLAIIMAEYILQWIPKKTHDYSKFVKPSELVNGLETTKLKLNELKGMSLSPITQKWYLSDDIDVNYFAVFTSKNPPCN